MQAEGLCAGYGRGDVLKEIYFSVKEGELCAVLGRNGSGKSTLLRAVCGLIPVDGRVELRCRPIRWMSGRERAAHIGYLSQRDESHSGMEVLDIVLMGLNPSLGLLESPGKRHRRQALDCLERMGVAELAGRNFTDLSQGQRQLVLLARTLVREPELLVLDEPDAPLDLGNRGRLFRLLEEYLAQDGRGGLLCSHDINAALAYTHRLLLLKEGHLAYDLPKEAWTCERLREALSDVYGPVELAEYKGRFVVLEEREE